MGITGVGESDPSSGVWDGCLGRSCAGRGESRGLPTVVRSALLPQEDGASDFG